MSSYINSCEERYYDELSDEYSNDEVEVNQDSEFCTKENQSQKRNEGGNKKDSSSKKDKLNNSKIRRKRRHKRYDKKEKKSKECLNDSTTFDSNFENSKINKDNTESKNVLPTTIENTIMIKKAYKIEVYENSLPVSLKQIKPIKNSNIIWKEGISFELIDNISNNECIKKVIENSYEDEIIKILKDADNAVKLTLQITTKYSKNLESVIEKIITQRIWRVKNIISHTTWAPILFKYPILRETHFSFIEFQKTPMVLSSSEKGTNKSLKSSESE